MATEHDNDKADGNNDGKSRKFDISTPQVAGGALASVTAAFLGGQLGVAGTVGGAALTSVVITVGGALYQRSLESTKEKANVAAAKAALKRAKGRPLVSGDVEATRRIDLNSVRPGDQGMHWPGGERVLDESAGDPDRTRRIQLPHGAGQESPPETGRSTSSRRRIRWAAVAVTSGLAFVLCMVIVTGFEGVTGRTLSGGEHGTTVGHIFRPGNPANQPPPPVPGESRTSNTPQPSQQPSSTAEPTVEPSSEPTVGPSRTRVTEQPERSTTPRQTQAPEPEQSRVQQEPGNAPSEQQAPQAPQQAPQGDLQQGQRVVPDAGSGSGVDSDSGQ